MLLTNCNRILAKAGLLDPIMFISSSVKSRLTVTPSAVVPDILIDVYFPLSFCSDFINDSGSLPITSHDTRLSI